MKASLVCPGPTLDWEKVDLDASVVVCVNSAVREAVRCDYWISADDMRAIHLEASPRALSLAPVVVADILPAARGRSRHRYGAWQDWIKSLPPAKKLVLKTWHPPRYLSKHCKFSMAFALCYMALRLGAKEIQVFGSPMSGVGYYDDELMPHWEKHNNPKRNRWKSERTLLSRVLRILYREHGVRVRRVR